MVRTVDRTAEGAHDTSRGRGDPAARAARVLEHRMRVAAALAGGEGDESATWQVLILDVLVDAGRPLAIAEIRATIQAMHGRVGTAMQTELARLVGAGVLVRPERGVYGLAATEPVVLVRVTEAIERAAAARGVTAEAFVRGAVSVAAEAACGGPR